MSADSFRLGRIIYLLGNVSWKMITKLTRRSFRSSGWKLFSPWSWASLRRDKRAVFDWPAWPEDFRWIVPRSDAWHRSAEACRGQRRTHPEKTSTKSRFNSSVKIRLPLYYQNGAADIAPWFRLRLPSCGRGFESQANHLHFFQFVLLKW